MHVLAPIGAEQRGVISIAIPENSRGTLLVPRALQI